MKHKPHQRPDEATLRHQCEFEHIPISQLRILYGYRSVTDLYYWCHRWGITPYRPPQKYDHLRQIPLSPEQHQIVLGTVLGDGFLNLDPRGHGGPAKLRMTHGERQRDYLEWKKKWLAPFVQLDKPYSYTQTHFNTSQRFVYDTIQHPVFSEYRALFYPNGKKRISQEILDKLEPLAVAIWIMDDGAFEQNSGWVNLATHSFSQEENNLAATWFKNRFNCAARVYPLRRLSQYFLAFNRPAVDTLRSVVRDHFFEPLLYKIGG